MKLVLKGLASVLLFLIPIDALLRLRLVQHITIDLEKSKNAKSQVLIVYLPGILASARISAGKLLDEWRECGDVLMVDYGDNRFVADDVIRATVEAITARTKRKDYRQIVLLGSSMGGMLAYDVIWRLNDSRDVLLPQIDLIVLDSPTNIADFVAPGDKLAKAFRILYPGPIVNRLNLIADMFIPPKEANIESGVDRKDLAWYISLAASYRFSFYADQIRYLMSHGPLPHGSLEKTVKTVTYVQCVRGNITVRPTAADNWLQAFKGTKVVQVDSTHVGFAERPHTWKVAFHDLLSGVIIKN